MKPILLAAVGVTLVTVLVSTPAFAGEEKTLPAVARVAFDHPERFADFRLAAVYREADSAKLQKELTSAVQASVAKIFPDGYTVEIRMIDVDLAGVIRQYYDLPGSELRTYERGFPPKVKFDYTVLDRQGNAMMSGRQELADRGYEGDMRAGQMEYTYFESRLLREFLRGIGRKLTKAGKT